MRLLLVEDESELARVLRQALEEEGFQVDSAADGEEGLFKAGEVDYDAILLDLMLPGLDGFEVLSRLREEGGRPVPVLVLTARDGVPDRVRGLNLGADDYLVKPFDLDEMLARVRALIRRSAARSPAKAGSPIREPSAALLFRLGFGVVGAATRRSHTL